MTLPRFTEGRVGRLGFEHLNEAFGYIDLARSEDGSPSTSSDKLPLVLATITGVADNDVDHSWAEIAMNPDGTTAALQGGRSSSLDGDAFAFPARSPTAQPMSVGTVVALVPKRTRSGASYYLAIVGGGAGAELVQIVRVEQNLFPNRMWSYSARYVRYETQQSTPTWVPYGPEWVVLNGCENTIDDGQFFGVGSRVPSGVNVTRLPLRPGVIALATRAGGNLTISVPNGYRYDCVQP